MDARKNFSFDVSFKIHLSSISGIRSLEDRKGS